MPAVSHNAHCRRHLHGSPCTLLTAARLHARFRPSANAPVVWCCSPRRWPGLPRAGQHRESHHAGSRLPGHAQASKAKQHLPRSSETASATTALCLDCLTRTNRRRYRRQDPLSTGAISRPAIRFNAGVTHQHLGLDSDINNSTRGRLHARACEFPLEEATLRWPSPRQPLSIGPGTPYRKLPTLHRTCHRKDEFTHRVAADRCASCHDTKVWQQTRFRPRRQRLRAHHKHREVPRAPACHAGSIQGKPRAMRGLPFSGMPFNKAPGNPVRALSFDADLGLAEIRSRARDGLPSQRPAMPYGLWRLPQAGGNLKDPIRGLPSVATNLMTSTPPARAHVLDCHTQRMLAGDQFDLLNAGFALEGAHANLESNV